MRILPVIDILRGVVVRGVAGNRQNYRPIQSRWTESAEPAAVAEALREAFGFRRFYLADLDGILAQQPNLDIYRRLADAGYELLVDAGVRDVADLGPILNAGASATIVGLETLCGPEALSEMVRVFGAERIVFSLDLRAGRPIIRDGADVAWSKPGFSSGKPGFIPNRRESQANQSLSRALISPEDIAAVAVDFGVQRMIVLDLADVGTGSGGSTVELCRVILQAHPDLTLIAGGGVRGPEDVRRWDETGVSELLVASALHDGRLSPDDVRS